MTSEPLRFRRAWVDPTVRPRPVAWFQLHAPGTGRMLGMFFSLPEARAREVLAGLSFSQERMENHMIFTIKNNDVIALFR